MSRRIAGLVASLAILAGCAAEPFEVKEGFFGGIAADEPRAALVGRDVMVEGGSAADAAVAMYFTLAVTLPSSAGLSATGSCLVFDPEKNSFEQLTFDAAPSAADGPAIALPVGPRAMYALHARHGVTEFAKLLGGAEKLARFGEPVSRRLTRDLEERGRKLAADAEAARIFLDGGARPLAQGELLRQFDLAGILARLRSGGIGGLYSGKLATSFAVAVERAGYRIDRARLRDALPRWTSLSKPVYLNHVWAVVGDDPADGARAAELLAGAMERDVEPAGFARATSSGATSFLAVDRFGQAVACAVGLNAPFGTGRVATGTGMLLAPAKDEPGKTPSSVALLVANLNVGQTHFLATGGGRDAVGAMVSAARRHYVGGVPTAEAVAPGSHVRLFRCANGIPKADIDCSMGDDPAAAGLVLFERTK